MPRFVLLSALLVLAATPAAAQKGGHGGHIAAHTSGRVSTYHAPTYHAPRYHAPPVYHVPKSAAGVRTPRVHAAPVPGARDAHGRLARSVQAKDDFLRSTGHPHGWPGHVVDHIVPLACGGADTPSNMQGQTTEEAKAKDKVERRGCGRR